MFAQKVAQMFFRQIWENSGKNPLHPQTFVFYTFGLDDVIVLSKRQYDHFAKTCKHDCDADTMSFFLEFQLSHACCSDFPIAAHACTNFFWRGNVMKFTWT